MAHDYDAENARATSALTALVGQLTDAQLATDLGGGWSVGTSLAHLAFWDRRAALIAQRWSRDGTPSPSPSDDDDIINPALDPIAAAVPHREGVRLALEAARMADDALAALTPALAAAALAPDSPINPRRTGHRDEHIAQIEAALRG